MSNIYESELLEIHLCYIKEIIRKKLNKNVSFFSKDKIKTIADKKISAYLKNEMTIPELIKYLIISVEVEKTSKKLKGPLKSARVLKLLLLCCESPEIKKSLNIDQSIQQQIIDVIISLTIEKHKINKKSFVKGLVVLLKLVVKFLKF